ncbi:hypothetical protein [Microvirga sesbaniae]|uniref:hypothetical protein n=1 Tax=Microvirga sesbaniae TaxID=681392 RepID=UPI0021CA9473|nr:hypothetical protein [Microvirga sp. HBU67692]
MRRRLEEHLDLRKSGLVEQEGRQFFANVQIPPIKLLVVGAVHVSQALAPMAAGLGLAVTIIDPCRGASGSCQAMLERAGTCATVREWWNGP